MYLELQNRLAEHLRAVLKDKIRSRTRTTSPSRFRPTSNSASSPPPSPSNWPANCARRPKSSRRRSSPRSAPLAGLRRIRSRRRRLHQRPPRSRRRRSVSSHAGEGLEPPSSGVHSLVEHTSINPNKAAHIGHLRNAILGDTFVRLLRAAGHKVDVQNYIDNTGVQVADVVVGFLHLEGRNRSPDVRAPARRAQAEAASASTTTAGTSTPAPRSGTTEGTDAGKRRAQEAALRHAARASSTAATRPPKIAELISTAVLRRHLETMLRLDIEYDFLPRESEILHLKFWDAAFEQLKKSGVLYFENEGKNKGCWVMTRPGAETSRRRNSTKTPRSSSAPTAPSPTSAKTSPITSGSSACSARTSATSPSSPIPITSAGSRRTTARQTTRTSAARSAIYNVIDTRQSDPQANVIQALRGMGYTEQADHYTHFSYEMVALTPRCAVELGYDVSDEDQTHAPTSKSAAARASASRPTT